MKYYKLIFYFIYRSALVSNAKDTPIFFSFIAVSVLQLINIGAIINILEIILTKKLIPYLYTEPIDILNFLPLFVINGFYIYRHKNYELIIEEGESWSEKIYKKYKMYTIIYVAFTFIAMFGTTILKANILPFY